jgi:hypothetical protein
VDATKVDAIKVDAVKEIFLNELAAVTQRLTAAVRLTVLHSLSPAEDLMTILPHLVHFLPPNAPQALILALAIQIRCRTVLLCSVVRYRAARVRFHIEQAVSAAVMTAMEEEVAAVGARVGLSRIGPVIASPCIYRASHRGVPQLDCARW